MVVIGHGDFVGGFNLGFSVRWGVSYLSWQVAVGSNFAGVCAGAWDCGGVWFI